MAGILSGLKNMGLGKLEGAKLYEEEKATDSVSDAAQVVSVAEKDLIYDRTFTCPVCEHKFTAKVMKTGKAKLLGMDLDLIEKVSGIEKRKIILKRIAKSKSVPLTLDSYNSNMYVENRNSY